MCGSGRPNAWESVNAVRSDSSSFQSATALDRPDKLCGPDFIVQYRVRNWPAYNKALVRRGVSARFATYFHGVRGSRRFSGLGATEDGDGEHGEQP